MGKRNLYVLLILITIAGIAGYYWFVKRIDNINTGNQYNIDAIEYNTKFKELKKQKEDLNNQIEELKQSLVIENMGSSIVLISDTDSRCLDDTVRLLDEYGYSAVIAIDDTYSPFDNIEGYLNEDDINNLVDLGYEVVLTINNQSNIRELYDLYSQSFDIKGYYCPSKDITNSQLKAIKETCNVVIAYDGTVEDKDIFSISSIGSYDTNSKNIFENSTLDSEIIAFSVGYNKSYDKFIESNVIAMLDRMKQAENNERLKVTNISGALDRYNDYLEVRNLDKYTQIDSQIEDLYKQIDEIDNQLYKQ